MTPATVAATVDALGSAFRSANVQAVLRCFAPEGDVLYAGSEVGEVAIGSTELVTLLERLFARDERYSWRTRTVRLLPGTAGLSVVAEARLAVHPVGGGPAMEEDVPYRITGLLEDAGNRWVWRSCQGAEPSSLA